MIVYKCWIQQREKRRPHSWHGDGTPVSELVGWWKKKEGWYLFGLIPLYIRDFEPRGYYTL